MHGCSVASVLVVGQPRQGQAPASPFERHLPQNWPLGGTLRDFCGEAERGGALCKQRDVGELGETLQLKGGRRPFSPCEVTGSSLMP